MNSVADAINTLISAVNVGHSKGAYSLEESHYIYLAIAYLNSLQQEQPKTEEAPEAVETPQQPQESVEQEQPPAQGTTY